MIRVNCVNKSYLYNFRRRFVLIVICGLKFKTKTPEFWEFCEMKLVVGNGAIWSTSDLWKIFKTFWSLFNHDPYLIMSDHASFTPILFYKYKTRWTRSIIHYLEFIVNAYETFLYAKEIFFTLINPTLKIFTTKFTKFALVFGNQI